MKESRKHIFLLIFLFFALGVFSVVTLHDSSDFVDYAPEPVEEPVVDAEYFSENTSLRYTVINGSFTSKSNVVYFEGLSRGSKNFTLSGYGKEMETNIWAANNGSGITSFPVEKGETVTLDFSRNYVNQLDQSVRLGLYTQRKGFGAIINYYNIYNGTATKNFGNRPYTESGFLEDLF